MRNNKLNILRRLGCLAIAAVTTLSLTTNAANASITSPKAPSTNNPLEETREILDRASFIAFQGASALQKLQTRSVDAATSELLKQYMASMIYIPHAMALPSDANVLDEPWLVTGDGVSDGMVVPNFGPDAANEAGIDLDAANPVKKYLRLLKPVQNAMITSGFGFRWGRPHQGIDMAAPTGTPILAAETGKVVYSGWKSGYGNFVAIDHGHGYQTHYAHCASILVRAGQQVKKGAVIAKVGSTGYSTGPHLHFEVVANGVHRNPVKFFNQTLTVVDAR